MPGPARRAMPNEFHQPGNIGARPGATSRVMSSSTSQNEFELSGDVAASLNVHASNACQSFSVSARPPQRAIQAAAELLGPRTRRVQAASESLAWKAGVSAPPSSVPGRKASRASGRSHPQYRIQPLEDITPPAPRAGFQRRCFDRVLDWCLAVLARILRGLGDVDDHKYHRRPSAEKGSVGEWRVDLLAGKNRTTKASSASSRCR